MLKRLAPTALFLIGIALFSVGCATDNGEMDVALERAEATVQSAIDALEEASQRALIAEKRAETIEKLATQAAQEPGRIEDVRGRGALICATGNDTPGFHYIDEAGQMVGFDIDLCRAVAAAVLGDASAVEFAITPLSEREQTLNSGEIDMMSLITTRTSTRDIKWGNYAPVMFYDGQGFMTRRTSGIETTADLDGAVICVTAGTTAELHVADYFEQNGLNYMLNAPETAEKAVEAYSTEQCDAISTDQSGLAAYLTQLPDPENHIILDEVISDQPLAPVIPHGDEKWFDIVKVVMAGLIYADAYGVDSTNVEGMAATADVTVKRLLGTEGSFGQSHLGLSETFMQDVIKQVGNYSEIFDRHVGENGLGLPRGRNALWLDGGQLYAPPLR